VAPTYATWRVSAIHSALSQNCSCSRATSITAFFGTIKALAKSPVVERPALKYQITRSSHKIWRLRTPRQRLKCCQLR
jgi:hypothetical protein